MLRIGLTRNVAESKSTVAKVYCLGSIVPARVPLLGHEHESDEPKEVDRRYTDAMHGTDDRAESLLEMKAEANADEKKRRERRGILYQMAMALCANSSVLGPAMGFGYSAVALGPLTSPKGDVGLSEVQANWIATASALGTPLGCVLSSATMRRGRRLSLMVTSVISMLGWLTIYMAGSYEQILVGRVISGIATGMASVPATVYTAEIAGAKWRSTMVTWSSVSIAIGVLLVYTFGYVFKDDWRLVALMCAIFPLISIGLTITLVPESPVWLRDRDRLEEAVEISKRFHGLPRDEAAPAELLLALTQRAPRKRQNLMKHLTKRNAIVPFLIMLTYFLFQQFSGLFVVIYYAVDIVESADVMLDPYLGAVLIGFTRLFGSLLVASVSNKYGRRIPSIVSGAGMTLFMGGLSVYLFLEDRGTVMSDGGFVPVICVLMYIFMSTLGFLVVPFAMVGEVYPTKVKDVLSGLTTCVAYVFSSVTVKTYPDMLALMGQHGTFFFYALVSLMGTIFILACLPETKGKTLGEIEDMFSGKKEVR
ncbi:hypothetical protein KM043_012315 [Ampulex compressa]|nr:hypothetical protein KM043_012315 [Ampulex compressa]